MSSILQQEYARFSEAVGTKQSDLRAARKILSDLSLQKEQKERILDLNEKAAVIIQKLMDKTDESIIFVEDMITEGLQAVFEDTTLKFYVKREFKRKEITFAPRLIQRGIDTSVNDSIGWGYVNVISFLLRLVVLLFLKKRALVTVWDEPFQNLGEEDHENVAALLANLAKRIDVQFIINTHMRKIVFESDTVRLHELERCGDKTCLKKQP